MANGASPLSDAGHPNNMLANGYVLVLEDEPFIAIDIEETLAAAGIDSVVSLDSVAEAEAWLAVHSPRLAILDPRLKDGLCSSVATILTERKVPFLVHSGDVLSAMEPETPFAAGIWITKPCAPEDLLRAVRMMLASRA